MKPSPRSSSSRIARRSLTFEPLPFADKTFYIDIKSASAKSKLIQRISSLGGQIENFLSKDLSLLITDKTAKQNTKNDCSQKPGVSGVPLSRGQALLLKASSQAISDTNNNNNHGLLQSATKLGIPIETPAGFLRQSSKLLEKIKINKHEDCLSGLSTISWDSEKENCIVIKVEDEEGLYRPLFKQFDSFPQISYNETGCPFDVGVVLTKTKECNQSKKKSVGGALRGGYCESCDHWYKCTLREHLNSDKHKQFVSSTENFKSLNQVSSSLPNLTNFVGKYGLKSSCSSKSNENDIVKLVKENQDSEGEKVFSEAHEGLLSLSDNFTVFKEIQGNEVKSKQRNSDISKSTVTQSCNINNSENDTSSQSQTIILSNSEKNGSTAEIISRSRSSKLCRKFSIDDVIKSVTDNEEYFSLDEDCEKYLISKTASIRSGEYFSPRIGRHGSRLKEGTPVSQPQSTLGLNKVNREIPTRTEFSVTNSSSVNLNKETDINGIRFGNIAGMCFSSSSCSFGDNGVGNALLILGSQHSSTDSETRQTENNTGQESCKSASSLSFNLLSESSTKDKHANILEDASSKCIDMNNDIKDVDRTCEMPVLDRVDVAGEGDTDLQFMPMLEAYDSEDNSCGSLLFDNFVKTSNVASVNFPEYSNITEESLQDKPTIDLGNMLKTTLQENVKCLGKDMKTNPVLETETPDKHEMCRLKSKIYENQANSGSTIRNWLLPADDIESVRSINSAGNLNNTLVNISYNIEEDERKSSKDCNDQNGLSISDIKETGDSTKVADWIQNQDFVTTNDSKFVNEQDLDCSKDFKPCSELSCGENEDMEMGSKAWSDTGTSISDCTLDNFNPTQEQNDEIGENVNGARKEMDVVISNHDETSQDSGISAKSGLTSVVTARGIKITGLSSLSSQFFNAVEGEQFTEASTVVPGSQSTHLYSNKSLYTSQSVCEESVTNIGYDSFTMNNNEENIQHQSYSREVRQDVSTGIDTQAGGKRNSKLTNTSSRKTKQVNPKKPRASKVSKGKKQGQSQSLLTQVLSSNLNSPSSSVFGNNFSPNPLTDSDRSATSQTFPYCQGQWSSQTNNQFGSQHMSSSDNTFVNNMSGYSMMDLLMSPNHQINSTLPQERFQQSPGIHSQNTISPLQQNQMVMKDAYYTSPLLHQPSLHQFATMSSPYQYNQTSYHSNKENHFLSSNSNFLMQNWQAGSSVAEHNRIGCQEPENTNNWNYPAAHCNFLSHDNSNSNGGLKTIDMSHIAENSREHESNFQFKVADVSKLKNKADSKKLVKRKSQKSKSNPVVTVTHSNNTISNNSTGNNAGYTQQPNVMRNNPCVYNDLNKQSQSTNLQFLSYNTASGVTASVGHSCENIVAYSPTTITSYDHNGVLNTLHSQQQMNAIYNTNSPYLHPQNYNAQVGYTHANKQDKVYNAVQTGDTKVTLHKMSETNATSVNQQPKHDLMNYWHVRKAGDCRLVFKVNGKRKADEETPSKLECTEIHNGIDVPLSKRRKCLVY